MEFTYFKFEWPTSAKTVIVTGSFDNWSKRIELSKNKDSNAFSHTMKIPKERIVFKYVVDGVWATNPNLKVEVDQSGNINNVIYAQDLTDPLNQLNARNIDGIKNDSHETQRRLSITNDSIKSVDTGLYSDKMATQSVFKGDSENHSFFAISHGDFSPNFGKLATENHIDNIDLCTPKDLYLDNGEDNDSINSFNGGTFDDVLNASTQVTIFGTEGNSNSSGITVILAAKKEDDRQFRYDSSMSLLSRFTKFFK